MNTYTLVPRVFFLRDETQDREKLLFHVRSGDYFGTLAGMLALVIDAIETAARANTPLPALVLKTLERARTDLAYLHDTHRIEAKESPEARRARLLSA